MRTILVYAATLAAVAVVILVVGYPIVWLADRIDNGARRATERERPQNIEKCERYGRTFDVQTKWENAYGCLEKRPNGWAVVKDVR